MVLGSWNREGERICRRRDRAGDGWKDIWEATSLLQSCRPENDGRWHNDHDLVKLDPADDMGLKSLLRWRSIRKLTNKEQEAFSNKWAKLPPCYMWLSVANRVNHKKQQLRQGLPFAQYRCTWIALLLQFSMVASSPLFILLLYSMSSVMASHARLYRCFLSRSLCRVSPKASVVASWLFRFIRSQLCLEYVCFALWGITHHAVHDFSKTSSATFSL